MTDELPPTRSTAKPEQGASGHYRRGNRLFEQKAWELALREWRQALSLWRPGERLGSRARLSLNSLRAVLLLLSTVCAVYWAIFTFFPRDPMDLFMIGAGQAGAEQSWWERFLETGRPGGGGDQHKMGVREWWERMRDRHAWGTDDRMASGERFRPTIDERWAELLRRYGRWGPMTLTELDLKVVSGYGLTAQGDYERAVAVTRAAIEEATDPEQLGELYQVLASAYYFQGYRHQKDRLASYDLKYIRLSADAYEKSVHYRPQVISMGNLGWTYFLLGEYRLSERYSLRALSFDDSLDYVRLNLGLLYLVQGDLGKSFDFYRRVAVRFPADDVYLGGITDLKEVLRDRPGRHAFANMMIGYLSLQRGDLPEARRNLKAYLAAPGADAAWRKLAQRWLAEPGTAVEG